MMNLSLGYFVYFQSDADYPDFVPILNSVFRLQPNPDDVYLYAPVRGNNSYRIVGDRGSVHILRFCVCLHFAGMSDDASGVLADYDADSLEIGPDGRFEVLLSADRPAGHTGNWWYLDPSAEHVLVRCRSYDWLNERDPRLSIERMGDHPLKPKIRIADIDSGIREIAGFSKRLSKVFLEWQNDVRQGGYVNRFTTTGFDELPGVPNQVYWNCVFELQPDEALILETQMPDNLRYWNVQLNDPLFNAVEFIERQSSLNGHTAAIDPDGWFRAVITLDDPGVANWLDPCGYETGTIIGRWTEADSCPMPTIRKVPLGDLFAQLPSSTTLVSPSERREALRVRRMGGQMRRRW